MGLVAPALAFYAVNGLLFGPVVAVAAALVRRTRSAAVWSHSVSFFVGLGAGGTLFYRVWQLALDGSMAGVPQLFAASVVAALLVGWTIYRGLERLRSCGWALWLTRPLPVGGAVLACLIVARGLMALTAGEAAASIATPIAQDREGPNVLLVIVDTLRADRLPSYGYEGGSTPHLEEFAGETIRYDRHYVASTWTRPSMATLYSGRLPSSHGVMFPTDALPDDVTTLAEQFREGGYRTSGFVTNYNFGPHFNFGQGFDEYALIDPDLVLGSAEGLGARISTRSASSAIGADIMGMAELLPLRLYQRFFSFFSSAAGTVSEGTVYQDAEKVNARAFEWLASAPAASPWFLVLGYMDPHHPYYQHPYDGTAFTRAAHEFPSPGDVPEINRLYDGEITYWDAHFGRLIDELKRRQLYDDALIIVTSDHGEEIGDHNGFYHGTTLFEEAVRVPLFVKLPGGKRAGEVVSHWTQSVDLMPTVLAWSGLSAPDAVQGANLDEGATFVLGEENHEGHDLASIRIAHDGEPWLLITANDGNPRGHARLELYRLERDPLQHIDVAARRPEIAEVLLERLEDAREQAAGGRSVQSIELNQSSRERLCALGYIQCP